MANPALGIIKIGIAKDVDERRKTLECACGVELEVLRVFRGWHHYELPLFAALAPHRLKGEWFNPCSDILEIVSGKETIPDFLMRMAPQVAAWEAEAQARKDRIRAEQTAKLEARKILEKEAKAQARAEKAQERAAKKLKQLYEKRQQRARQVEAAARKEERMRTRALQAEWERKSGKQKRKYIQPEAEQAAAERRQLLQQSQRARNSAHVGLNPTATYRDQRPPRTTIEAIAVELEALRHGN